MTGHRERKTCASSTDPPLLRRARLLVQEMKYVRIPLALEPTKALR